MVYFNFKSGNAEVNHPKDLYYHLALLTLLEPITTSGITDRVKLI